MTGLELFEALSFVDARYIAEAETAKLGRKIPWMKYLSVAACLCILIAGAFGMKNLGVMEKAPAADAPAAAAPMEDAPAADAPAAEAPMLEEDLSAEYATADEPAEDIYVPYPQVTVHLDGNDYVLETKEGGALLELLKNQVYEESQRCKCDIDFTVVTEFGMEYQINLQEGFARTKQGQAFLSSADVQKIEAVLAKLPQTLPAELHHVVLAQVRILNVLEDGSYEVFVEKVAEEPRPFDAGVQMILVIDPEMIPAADRTNMEYPGDVTVDMLVEIQNGVYDAGINTLYAEGVLAAAQE